MNEHDDQIVISLSEIYRWIRALLAAIGLISLSAIIGLYCGGFFHYIARRNPGGVIATLLGIG